MNATEILKALSDDTRLRIVSLLAQHDQMVVSDLVAALDMPQWHVSRHLGRLRAAGVVDCIRRGPCMCYALRTELRQAVCGVVAAARQWLDESVLASDLGRLNEALERRHKQEAE